MVYTARLGDTLLL